LIKKEKRTCHLLVDGCSIEEKIVSIVVIHWKGEEKMLEIFQYTGIVLVLAIALVGIAKDWSINIAKIRWPMLVFVILGAGVSIVSTHLSIQKSKTETERLVVSEETTRTVLSDQNALLLDKVIELEGKVRSEELRSELGNTRKELEKTQNALKPGPKAKLVFSIRAENEIRFDQDNPRKEITLPIIDDSLKVSFLAMNVTDVFATEVRIWVQICDTCEFIEEPKYFEKLELSTPQTRWWHLGTSPNKTIAVPIELKIKPPPMPVKRIGITFRVRCKECEPTENQRFWVNIANR
jgi:hypothetical protein